MKPRWAVFFLAWAVFSLLAAVWSIATPIGGAPDEPAHMIKAASVVRGEFIGRTTFDGQLVHVPAYIAYTPAQTCYAFNPLSTPACSAPLAGNPDKIVASTTSAGLYNPLYYALVGWPRLFANGEVGTYLMRLASALLSSVFLAAAAMIISTWRHRFLPAIGLAVAATPMVFFLNGVVNPNSVEATATLAAFVGVLSVVRDPDARLTLERTLIVMVSAAIAVNMRGLSPLWVAIALWAPFILIRRKQVLQLSRETSIRTAVIGIVVAVALSALWIVRSNSLGAGINDPLHPVSGSGQGSSPLSGFIQIFAGTFNYGRGLIGEFGWLDTPAPAPVLFVWSALIGTLVVAGIVALRGRELMLVLALASSLVLVPPVIQAAYVTGGGIVWQGRYGLAPYLCLIVGTAALLSRFTTGVLESKSLRRLTVIVLSAWAMAQVLAYVFTLKRYEVGTGAALWKPFFLHPAWEPPGGTILAIVLATAAFALGAVLFGRLTLQQSAMTPTIRTAKRRENVSP